MREPAGDQHIHRGADELRALYRSFFANGGGIPLEHCAVIDGPPVRSSTTSSAGGRTKFPPAPGIAVDGRGDSGKLASARVYDDSQPPLS